LEQQHRETDEAIRKVLHAIEKMDYSDALAERLSEHEARRATIKREQQTLEVPQLIDLSRLAVPCDMSAIHTMRQTEQGLAAWRDVIERLMTRVDVTPPSWNLAVDGHAQWSVVLHGNLPALDAHWAEMDAMEEAMEEGLSDEERADMRRVDEACAAEAAALDAKAASARAEAQAKHAKWLKRRKSVKMVAGVGFEPTTFRL
jgi:hypothetical protein